MGSLPTKIDVCVCTYRRALVRDTILSLAHQDLRGQIAMRVVVVDNDTSPSARTLVHDTAAGLNIDLAYVHAPAGNISIARNAAIDSARGEWIAFLDDDETAALDWLSELLATASATGADLVFGPVRPAFEDEPPSWMSDGQFHLVEPTVKNGRIVAGYAGNVLISRRAIDRTGERFDPRFGRTGGEDTDFFDRLLRQGATAVYAPNATVHEAVPPDRTSLTWLVRRRFRYGQIHGAMVTRLYASRTGRVRAGLLALAKGAACLAGMLANPFPTRRRTHWLLRGALHLGVVQTLLGGGAITAYGRSENSASTVAPGFNGESGR